MLLSLRDKISRNMVFTISVCIIFSKAYIIFRIGSNDFYDDKYINHTFILYPLLTSTQRLLTSMIREL